MWNLAGDLRSFDQAEAKLYARVANILAQDIKETRITLEKNKDDILRENRNNHFDGVLANPLDKFTLDKGLTNFKLFDRLPPEDRVKLLTKMTFNLFDDDTIPEITSDGEWTLEAVLNYAWKIGINDKRTNLLIVEVATGEREKTVSDHIDLYILICEIHEKWLKNCNHFLGDTENSLI